MSIGNMRNLQLSPDRSRYLSLAGSSLSPSAGGSDQCRSLLRTGSLDVLGFEPSAVGAPSDLAEGHALSNMITKEYQVSPAPAVVSPVNSGHFQATANSCYLACFLDNLLPCGWMNPLLLVLDLGVAVLMIFHKGNSEAIGVEAASAGREATSDSRGQGEQNEQTRASGVSGPKEALGPMASNLQSSSISGAFFGAVFNRQDGAAGFASSILLSRAKCFAVPCVPPILCFKNRLATGLALPSAEPLSF
ncbi:hypothetical protein Nepgr_008049 [Nepenthes gracilis]|uniref:Uncharacterized protein n=1 Tax=Nepenthes gracilis TaxID=150966 RepID=A0AAD3XIW9_NEPGR|nr:hypothetical protein Nepgr_008049 [Nepenthes gracilis]